MWQSRMKMFLSDNNFVEKYIFLSWILNQLLFISFNW